MRPLRNDDDTSITNEDIFKSDFDRRGVSHLLGGERDEHGFINKFLLRFSNNASQDGKYGLVLSLVGLREDNNRMVESMYNFKIFYRDGTWINDKKAEEVESNSQIEGLGLDEDLSLEKLTALATYLNGDEDLLRNLNAINSNIRGGPVKRPPPVNVQRTGVSPVVGADGYVRT